MGPKLHRDNCIADTNIIAWLLYSVVSLFNLSYFSYLSVGGCEADHSANRGKENAHTTLWCSAQLVNQMDNFALLLLANTKNPNNQHCCSLLTHDKSASKFHTSFSFFTKLFSQKNKTEFTMHEMFHIL
jgi:hypothetical protein